MKRIFFLIVFLMLPAAGCSGTPANPELPSRADALPDAFVSLLAAAPMKLAFDRADAPSGYAGWAWEETGGTPKLLLVEIWAAPADVVKLYGQAEEGAEAVQAPEGAEACCNGRATFIKTDRYFIRIVTLGFMQEKEALGMLVSRLAYRAAPAR
jgi:hypothetical protein